MLIKKIKIPALLAGLSFFTLSNPCYAVDPFEDFHEYGELSDEEIHELHKGEFLYGDTEFGLIINKGNAENTAFKLKGNLYQDFTHWRNHFKFDGLYREDTDAESGEETVSAERYFVSMQGNYKIGEDNQSLFLYADYEDDEFSGKEYTATLALGYGTRLFEGRKNTVDFDIGPGLSVTRTDDEIELSADEQRVQQGQLLRMALQWERKVSERTRFNQDVSIERSLSGLNTRVFSETALVTQVLGGIGFKVAYTYRYNSMPEDDKLKRDSEVSATLIYSFSGGLQDFVRPTPVTIKD
jgi:putative salt-induced outer membrane protein YdiY